MPLEVRIPIAGDVDIVTARSQAKSLAADLGFSRTDQTVIAAAVSEVDRNVVVYAGAGEMVLRTQRGEGRWGLMVVTTDRGPGIADLELAMTDGFSTASSLGVGLPGARRLMDSLEIESQVGQGTTVTMLKWARPHG